MRSSLDYRMAWYVIIGSIPIGAVRLRCSRTRSAPAARNLWLVATMLIVFAFVLAFAEYCGPADPHARATSRMRDGVVMGFAQAMALIPGVSRSGGTLIGRACSST